MTPEQLQAILTAHAHIIASNVPKPPVNRTTRTEVAVAILDEELEEEDAKMEDPENETEAANKTQDCSDPKGCSSEWIERSFLGQAQEKSECE